MQSWMFSHRLQQNSSSWWRARRWAEARMGFISFRGRMRSSSPCCWVSITWWGVIIQQRCLSDRKKCNIFFMEHVFTCSYILFKIICFCMLFLWIFIQKEHYYMNCSNKSEVYIYFYLFCFWGPYFQTPGIKGILTFRLHKTFFAASHPFL